MNKRIRHLSAADYMKGNEMPNKCKKCGNKDNYNFALNIGLCNSCIAAELEQLKAKNKELKNSMICLWCKKTMPKDTVKLTEHLLECKDHPLARRIEQLQAENEQQADFMALAKEEMDALQAELDKHRWIPVSERLPEKEGGAILYLVICTGHVLERCFYKDTWLRGYTHWKPIILPETEELING